MKLNRLRIDSRVTLIAIAFCGLVLACAPNMFSLSRASHSAMVLAGTVVLVYVAFNLFNRTNELAPEKASPDSGLTASCALSSIALLLIRHVAPKHSWSYVIVSIAAWLLCFICWLMPKSGWQTVPYIAFYLLALMGVRWTVFRTFESVPAEALIALTMLWVLSALITFLILDRRKTSPS